MEFPAQLRAPLLLGVAMLVGLSGCSRSHPKLDAIAADPMASATFDHARLAQQIDTPEGRTLGKPRHAQVVRRFSFSGIAPEDLVRAAGATSRAHGWDQRNARTESFTATKDVDGVLADLVITIGDYRRERWLFVYITARD